MFAELAICLSAKVDIKAEMRKETVTECRALFKTEVEKEWKPMTEEEYEMFFRLLIEEVNKNN